MKYFLAALACLGNMVIVLGIITEMRSSMPDMGSIASLLLLLLTLFDITYVNYVVWTAVTKRT